jgi:histidyl-tRNA synthetase
VLIVDRRLEVFRREEQVKGELRKFPQVDAPSDRS